MREKELVRLYDDFKFKKKTLVSMVYTKIFQRCKGSNVTGIYKTVCGCSVI